jgi:ComF family protein
MILTLKHWLEHALQPHCAFCGLPRLDTQPLCQACYHELPWLPPEANRPIPDCDECHSAFTYHPPINNLLLGIKFGRNIRELATVGNLTATGILHQLEEIPEAILPIPLHSKRLHRRGFNQALELARPLAKQLRLPLLDHNITRRKATQAQTELNAQQRQQNLHQAFAIRKSIPYCHVAIFDDVITTGATAGELARLLRSQGVQRVDIWSCARTILRQNDAPDHQIDYH